MSLLTDLLAYWAFDGDQLDATGNPFFNGTNSAPTFAAGKLAQALSVSNASTGAGGRSQLAASWAIQGSIGGSKFSLSAWINPSALPATYGQIVGHDGGGHAFYLKSDGKLSYYDFENASDHLSTSVIPTGAWTHVGFSYAGSQLQGQSGIWKIYVNGALDASGTQAVLKGYIGSIGGYTFGGGGGVFLGLIDEVGAWKDRELSAADMLTLWNGGAGLSYALFGGPAPVPPHDWMPRFSDLVWAQRRPLNTGGLSYFLNTTHRISPQLLDGLVEHSHLTGLANKTSFLTGLGG